MFVVYALYSRVYDKIYIGFTSNMEERFKSHNELSKKGWTVKFRPWEINLLRVFFNKGRSNEKGKRVENCNWQSIYQILDYCEVVVRHIRR